MIAGTFYSTVGHVSYPRIVTNDVERQRELRTNENFRNRFQREHHLATSALEMLPIDMVKTFPVSDDLHLLHLGVMKRFKFLDFVEMFITKHKTIYSNTHIIILI